MPKRNGKHSQSSTLSCVEDDASDASSLNSAQIDLPRIERAVREILFAIGEDPDREGLLRTPNRVARAYGELMAGLNEDPRVHLRTVINERSHEADLLRDLTVHSHRALHLLPFVGKAHVAYL